MKLSKKNLSRKPQRVTPDAWYYEENDGIQLYWDMPRRGPALVCVIPWRKLRASLHRKDDKKEGT